MGIEKYDDLARLVGEARTQYEEFINGKKIAVAVLLTGGKPCIGPAAAGVAGGVYKRLTDGHYSLAKAEAPASLVSNVSTGN